MEGYGYPYAPGFQAMRPPETQYLDHGDGYGEYYGMGPVGEDLGRRLDLEVECMQEVGLVRC